MNLDFMFKILPNGEQYATAKWVVFILAISKLFVSVCSIGVSVLNYSRFYYYSLIFSAFYTIISIVFNNSFIPLWGMNGAALATLLSSVLYYAALLGLNYLKIKTCPFSSRQLQVLGLLLCFGLVDFILEYFTSQILPKTVFWGFVEAIFRTGIVSLLAVIIIYRLKFSEELNTLIDYIIMKLRRNK